MNVELTKEYTKAVGFLILATACCWTAAEYVILLIQDLEGHNSGHSLLAFLGIGGAFYSMYES